MEQKKRDGERLFAPPGFAPLFPELSGIERNMALYDATERQARIIRVQQSLEPGFIEKDVHHPRISHDVNKGKGHGQALSEPVGDLRIVLASGVNDQEASSSTSPLGPTVFRVGSYSGNLSTESRVDGKKSRRRPQKWKRLRNPEKQRGVEEIVWLGWGPSVSPGSNTPLADRINRCRRELAKWKRVTTVNAGVSDLIDARYGTWDVARVRHLFVEEDANHILGMKLDHRREDTLDIRDKLSFFRLWTVAFAHIEGNRCAEAIATSVTRDHRYSSYIAHAGPFWLASELQEEALGEDQ
ncbi:hypothetical protein HID58_064670 [Brassica napus]|uniref:RNase H type-1 domain-containing protein n=1 Tax=Brassica napus TaxID=3708 RepID=A0ABQ7ZAN4_BRANA|nr:hypothetical protein HID58_064670 [Brassica napus]